MLVRFGIVRFQAPELSREAELHLSIAIRTLGKKPFLKRFLGFHAAGLPPPTESLFEIFGPAIVLSIFVALWWFGDSLIPPLHGSSGRDTFGKLAILGGMIAAVYYFTLVVAICHYWIWLRDIQQKHVPSSPQSEQSHDARHKHPGALGKASANSKASRNVLGFVDRNGCISCPNCGEAVRPFNSVLTNRSRRIAQCPYCMHRFEYLMPEG
jgi:hypothetical protein